MFCKNEIKAIKFKYKYIFLVTGHQILIFDIFMDLKLVTEIKTFVNFKGKIEMNSIDKPSIVCYIPNH